MCGTAFAAALIVFGFAHEARAQSPGGDAAIQVSGNPQLFLDDDLVAKTQNLKRELQTPRRHPRNPLIVQDRPWEKRVLELFGTVIYDERVGKFRCWYLASVTDGGIPDTPEAPGLAEYFQCYAESDDGILWHKPNVGARAHGGYREHNIVLPRAHGFCVLPTPDDADPRRRYKGLGGNDLGFSADGLAWSMQTGAAKNWAAAVGKNDTNSCVVRWAGRYLAFVRYQEPEHGVTDAATGIQWQGVMRGVGQSVSADFNTWTPKKSIFRTDARDGFPWTQPYGLCVTPYGDVLIGLVPMLHLTKERGNNTFGSMDVQMLVSRDGRKWARVADRAVFLPATSDATVEIAKRPWDAWVYPATTMFVRDDTVYIYYTGQNLQHGERRRTPSLPAKFGIGLATLPADPADAEGVFQTRPFRSRGKSLLVNAEVAVNDLQVEVCDGEGTPLPGFERHRSRLAVHDRLRYEVHWKANGRAGVLADAMVVRPVIVLRIFLRNGALYAWQIVP